MNSHRHDLLCFYVALLFGLISNAPAASVLWIGTNSSNPFWNTADNWSGGVPDATTDVGGANTGAITSTVINSAATASVKDFSYNGSNGSWDVTGAGNGSQLHIYGNLVKSGSNTLSFRKEGGALQSNGLSVVVDGNISLSGGNLVLGATTNRLASLTVKGTTQVSSGNLQIGVETDYSLGQLNVTGGSVYLNLRVASSGARTISVNGLSGTSGIIQSANNAGNAANLVIDTATGTSYSSATSLRDGNTDSQLSVRKQGAGTQVLAGNNTYTGATYIDNGILGLGSAGALGGGGNITFGGGTLQYGASNAVDYSTKIVNSTEAVTIDTNGQTVTYSTALSNSNTGGLRKTGNGTLTLKGQQQYLGTTSVSQGTLVVEGSIAGDLLVSGGTAIATSSHAINGANLTITSGIFRMTASDAFNATASVQLGGGRFEAIGALTQSTTGALSLTGNSVLDFGSGSLTLTFGAIEIDGTLSIYNWTEGVDHLFITSGSFSGNQGLDSIRFYSGDGTGYLGTAEFSGTELTVVPEPSVSTLCLIGFGLGVGLMRVRRARS